MAMADHNPTPCEQVPTLDDLMAWGRRVTAMYAEAAALQVQAAQEERKLRAAMLVYADRPVKIEGGAT